MPEGLIYAMMINVMRTIKLCCLCALLFLALAPTAIYGQDQSAEDARKPAPYEEDEFPQWLQTVRRFEIIAIGSFPLTYLLALIAYDFVKFTIESINIGSVNSLYAPLFFAPSNKPPPTQMETVGIVLATVGASVVVAIIDLIIQETRRTRIAEKARIEEAIRRDRYASYSQ